MISGLMFVLGPKILEVKYELDNETIEDIREATCVRSQGNIHET
jgi:hypothetical protein